MATPHCSCGDRFSVSSPSRTGYDDVEDEGAACIDRSGQPAVLSGGQELIFCIQQRELLKIAAEVTDVISHGDESSRIGNPEVIELH